MSGDVSGQVANTHEALLDQLEHLLERQIELLGQGRIGDVERLSEQAGSVVAEIADSGTLELPEHVDRREQLQQLYERLRLAVSAQQAEVGGKLSQIRRGRKTIRTYRGNI